MLTDSVRYAPLRENITDPATAARHVVDGTNLLALRSIRLLASRERQYVGLQGFGIEITDTESFG